MISIFFCLH